MELLGMIFLQADTVATALSEYGVLGIFCFLLIGGLVFVFKMLISQVEKRLDQTQKDLDSERDSRIRLQERFDSYIAEDRNKILGVLERTCSILERVEKKLNG
jgi:hypothetical protein